MIEELLDKLCSWVEKHERLFWGSLIVAEIFLLGLIFWGWWQL